jgi:hypothetical protein
MTTYEEHTIGLIVRQRWRKKEKHTDRGRKERRTGETEYGENTNEERKKQMRREGETEE